MDFGHRNLETGTTSKLERARVASLALFRYIFDSLYMLSYQYTKFQENRCVGTDESTRLNILSSLCSYAGFLSYV